MTRRFKPAHFVLLCLFLTLLVSECSRALANRDSQPAPASQPAR